VRPNRRAFWLAANEALDGMQHYTEGRFTIRRLRTPGRHSYELITRGGAVLRRGVHRSQVLDDMIGYIEQETPMERLADVANDWAEA